MLLASHEDENNHVSIQVHAKQIVSKSSYIATIYLEKASVSVEFSFLINAPVGIADCEENIWDNDCSKLDAVLLGNDNYELIGGIYDYIDRYKKSTINYDRAIPKGSAVEEEYSIFNKSSDSPLVLCTEPIYKFGKLLLYDDIISNCFEDRINFEEIIIPTTNDVNNNINNLVILNKKLNSVDDAFDKFKRVRFLERFVLIKSYKSKQIENQSQSDDFFSSENNSFNDIEVAQITVTAHSAGTVLGGAAWLVEFSDVDICSVLLTTTYSTNPDMLIEPFDFNNFPNSPTIIVTICPFSFNIENNINNDANTVLSSKNDIDKNNLCNIITEIPYINLISETASINRIVNSIKETLISGGSVQIPINIGSNTLFLFLLLSSFWNQTSDMHQYPVTFVSSVGSVFLDFAKTLIEWMSPQIRNKFTNLRVNPFINDLEFLTSITPYPGTSKRRLLSSPSHLPQLIITSPDTIRKGFSSIIFAEHICTDSSSKVIYLTEPSKEDLKILEKKKKKVHITRQIHKPLSTNALYDLYNSRVKTNDLINQENSSFNYNNNNEKIQVMNKIEDKNIILKTKKETVKKTDKYKNNDIKKNKLPLNLISPSGDAYGSFITECPKNKIIIKNVGLSENRWNKLLMFEDETEDMLDDENSIQTISVEDVPNINKEDNLIPEWRQKLRDWNGGVDPTDSNIEKYWLKKECKYLVEPMLFSKSTYPIQFDSESFCSWVDQCLRPMKNIIVLNHMINTELLMTMLKTSLKIGTHKEPYIELSHPYEGIITKGSISLTLNQKYLNCGPNLWNVISSSDARKIFKKVPEKLILGSQIKNIYKSNKVIAPLKLEYKKNILEIRQILNNNNKSIKIKNENLNLNNTTWSYLGKINLSELIEAIYFILLNDNNRKVRLENGILYINNDICLKMSLKDNKQILELSGNFSATYFAIRKLLLSAMTDTGHIFSCLD